MAAPIGHIICALALLNNGHEVSDKNAFLAGTSFPDIRYISKLNRAHTHKLESTKLANVLDAKPFEAGRRFHAWVDLEREKYMKENGAYEFVKVSPYPAHMLKIIEDHILREKLKLDARKVFDRIYDEEIAFLSEKDLIKSWHQILLSYLDDSHWFYFTNYLNAWREYQKISFKSEGFFKDLRFKIKILGFAIYAYVQLNKLSQDPNLRSIILGFYEDKIFKLTGSKFVPN